MATTIDAITSLPKARAWGQGGGARPPKPTRDQICHIVTSGMQGTYVEVTQPGGKKVIPFTDGLLTSPLLTPEDRQAVYAAKRAYQWDNGTVGDTHCILNVSWNYSPPDLTYEMPGRDLTNDLATFRTYVEEALDAGFFVIVMLAGDGNPNPPKPDGTYDYADPAGWTYGWHWLMDNFARIHAALADLDPWLIYASGYDGVIPAWQPPSCVDKWAEYARSILGPNGYLLQHCSTGYCWWGHDDGTTETNNWETKAGQCFDIVTTCMPVPMQPPHVPPPPNFMELDDMTRQGWDGVWQIEGRLIKDYKRPPDQPPEDDANPPYFLGGGTPRGPFHHCCLEICTYGVVRGHHDVEYVMTKRRYLRAMNCLSVG